MKYGIVVLGYNRKGSLLRLLKKLNNCYYSGEKVDLIISLDFSGSNDLVEVAESYEWKHGDKIIKAYGENLGLRRHVLTCGNYMNEYKIDAIAVFEDDIYPSDNFFNYMKAAVEFYKDEDSVAGISLYSHQWNVNAGCVFEPYKSEYDTYFLQYAQSWGQVWIREKWNEFYNWYLENQKFIADESLPEFVNSWPESSWLKYHIKYCVEKNKFFVYPYVSYTTCFAEVGTHTKRKSTLQQVVMQGGKKEEYKFAPISKDMVRYDAFFERIFEDEFEISGIRVQDICINLFQTKSKWKERYMISTEVLNYKIIKSFALQIRPHEENVLQNIEGNEIFLYDCNNKERNSKASKKQFWLVKEYRNKVAINRKILCDMLFNLGGIR